MSHPSSAIATFRHRTGHPVATRLGFACRLLLACSLALAASSSLAPAAPGRAAFGARGR